MRIKSISVLFLLTATSISYANVLKIKTWKTKAGTPVYFVPSKSVPMLNVLVQFRAGSSDEGQAYGLATLTNALLTEGTKADSAQNFSNKVTQLGSDINSDSGKLYSTISLQTLTKPNLLQPSLSLFTQAITQAAFRDKAIARLKNDMLASLKAQAQDPASTADLQLNALLFKGTSYAHNELGTPKTIATLSAQQIRAFYHNFYQQRNATIFIVGAISQAEAHQIATQLLQGLPRGNYHPPIKIKQTPQKPITQTITFPANQTYIRLATLSLNPKENTRFKTIVANYLLGGGGLTSILNDVIREKHGLSYNVASAVTHIANAEPWLITLQTKNANAPQALTLTQNTVKTFTQKGATPDQLKAAKDFLINSMPLRFTSNSQILAALVFIDTQHLPLNFFTIYPQKIKAVSNQDIIQVAKQGLIQKPMVTVMVGGQS